MLKLLSLRKGIFLFVLLYYIYGSWTTHFFFSEMIEVEVEIEVRQKDVERFRVIDTDKFLNSNRIQAGSRKSVCLVTAAISSPTLSGGIASAFHNLALHLGEDERFEVYVVYTPHPYYQSGTVAEHTRFFKEHNVTFIPLPGRSDEYYGSPLMVRSYRVMQYLLRATIRFDIISFHDYMGLGYYTTMLKRQGLGFSKSILMVQLHSTLLWSDILGERSPKSYHTLGYYHMEKKSIEWADVRISPSRYYLDWLESSFMPARLSSGHNFILHNLVYPLPTPVSEKKIPKYSNHLVFFSRLEVRKGLFVFLQALKKEIKGVSAITFLGPKVNIDGESSIFVIERSVNSIEWITSNGVEVNFITDKGSAAAIQHIKVSNGIAVMPTLGENSPYVVLEMIAHRVPFITTDAGGGLELMDRVSPDNIVRAGCVRCLYASLQKAMSEKGLQPVGPSVPFDVARSNYLDVLEVLGSWNEPAEITPAKYGDYSVVFGITSHDRPETLIKAVKSVLAQNYDHSSIRIIVVDDASTVPGIAKVLEEIRHLAVKERVAIDVIRNEENKFVAANRNYIFKFGVEQRADYVCLLDDDDVLYADMTQNFMTVAANTDADVLVSLSDNFISKSEGNQVFSHLSLALGNSEGVNTIINFIGKGTLCAKPKVVASFRGHDADSELSNSPFVDWQMLTRAYLNNCSIELVPLPAYRYTQNSKDSLLHERKGRHDIFRGHMKIVRDILAGTPEHLRDFMYYSLMKLRRPELSSDGIF
ncbi:hypothetical protein SARC_13229 [Sphaeroforma arctica JP610]|uniref:Glycosyltransferase 2-like domain-containing protein n=1 Tax=Sphaeroforma arctica JP610 TaxID=667725 RepID=A0A0L0FBT0_9EUKA|nr:hypothetical protein SARC_13229 [Sphaeroforma arctica JP610]KNC74217.1 hypothetical protein SARC_13229 [Sphaeroforma arctica JP610]|eukprot:XP_014148119.1 hypothetical protein SARC_13229 [Sphaeroforma arctica JP610]